MNSRTIIVAKDGTGDYGTIQPALDAAQPGDIVYVRKGVYTEDLNLRQGVTLRGEESEETRIIAASGNALKVKNVTNATVSNLFIDGDRKGYSDTIYVTSSTVKINNCEITGGRTHGIEAKGKGTRIKIWSNTIRSNHESGVWIHEEAEGVIKENIIAENGLHGISSRDQGKVAARANIIRGNQQAGMAIYDKGEGVIEENVIAENGLHGVVVQNQSKLTARGQHHCSKRPNWSVGL